VSAILKPLGIGLLGFFISGAAFWFGFAFLLLPAADDALAWFPAAVIALPLLVAGYLGARFTVSAHRSRRVLVGALTGAIGISLVLILGQSQGLWRVFALFVLGAGAWSALGGLVGVATNPNDSE